MFEFGLSFYHEARPAKSSFAFCISSFSNTALCKLDFGFLGPNPLLLPFTGSWEVEVEVEVDWASDIEVRWDGTMIGFGRGGAGHYIPSNPNTNISQSELDDRR